MLGFMQMSMFKKLLNSPSEAKVRNSIISEMRSGRISEDLNKCFIKFEDIEHHIEELKKKNRNADVLLDKGYCFIRTRKNYITRRWINKLRRI